MKHYGRVFLMLALWWLAGLVLMMVGASLALSSAEALVRAGKQVEGSREVAMAAEKRAISEEARMPLVSSFLASWDPHVKAESDDREVGLQMRAGLEALAQQRLGLVTDQATTPEPARVVVGGRTVRMQRVGLRATGDNLGALVAWLGEAEAQFPYARVDFWELSSAGASNCALRVLFAHPLNQDAKEKKGGELK